MTPEARRKVKIGLALTGLFLGVVAVGGGCWWINRERRGVDSENEDLDFMATTTAQALMGLAGEATPTMNATEAYLKLFGTPTAVVSELATPIPAELQGNLVGVEGLGCWTEGRGRNGERLFYDDEDPSTIYGLRCDNGIWKGWVRNYLGQMVYIEFAGPSLATPIGGKLGSQ